MRRLGFEKFGLVSYVSQTRVSEFIKCLKAAKSAAQNALNAVTLIFHRAFRRRCFSKLKVGKLRHKLLKVESEGLVSPTTPHEKAPPSRSFTLEDTNARSRTPLNRMAVFFPVAAASRQVLVIEFGVFCRRFFLYHETLSTLLSKGIKAYAFAGKVTAWARADRVLGFLCSQRCFRSLSGHIN